MGVDVNLVIGEGVRVGIGLGVGKGLNTMGVGLRTTIGPTVGTGLGFGLGVAVGAGAGAPGNCEQFNAPTRATRPTANRILSTFLRVEDNLVRARYHPLDSRFTGLRIQGGVGS